MPIFGKYRHADRKNYANIGMPTCMPIFDEHRQLILYVILVPFAFGKQNEFAGVYAYYYYMPT